MGQQITIAAFTLALALAGAGVSSVVAAPAPEEFLFPPGMSLAVMTERVVTALTLEPDPALADLLVAAAVREAHAPQGDDPAAVVELLASVLLVLPEDAARALAPRLLARAAGMDDEMRLHLAAAVAPAVGLEAADLAAEAGRLAHLRTVARRAERAPVADAGGRPIPVSAVEVIPPTALAAWASGGAGAAERWLGLIGRLRPYLTSGDIADIARLWGMAPEQLLTLLDGGSAPRPPDDGGGTASPW